MVLGSTVEMLNTFPPAPMAPERDRRSGKRATGGRETQGGSARDPVLQKSLQLPPMASGLLLPGFCILGVRGQGDLGSSSSDTPPALDLGSSTGSLSLFSLVDNTPPQTVIKARDLFFLMIQRPKDLIE